MPEILVECCAGLDVHKAEIVACVLKSAGRKEAHQTRHFSAFTDGLTALAAWLKAEGVTTVALESTGAYWLPVYAALEDQGLQLVVGNAQHIKNVPGRKTDVSDARWLATLVRFGLIRASYVPPREQRRLRDLLRMRRHLVEQRTDERNRLQQLLELGGIKLGCVVSDCFGRTGLAILRQLAQAETPPAELAALAVGGLKKKRAELVRATEGHMDDHVRFLLRLALQGLDSQDQRLETLEAELARQMEPYEAQVQKLIEIPGVQRLAAAILVAEIGVEMKVFPTAGHLASWAGVCPGNHQSAGKVLPGKGGRVRPGNRYLKTLLIECAQAAVKTKDSFWAKVFRKLRVRRGYKKAIMAIAHKLLVVVYQVLSDQETRYRETVEANQAEQELQRRLKQVHRAALACGYRLILEKEPAPS